MHIIPCTCTCTCIVFLLAAIFGSSPASAEFLEGETYRYASSRGAPQRKGSNSSGESDKGPSKGNGAHPSTSMQMIPPARLHCGPALDLRLLLRAREAREAKARKAKKTKKNKKSKSKKSKKTKKARAREAILVVTLARV